MRNHTANTVVCARCDAFEGQRMGLPVGWGTLVVKKGTSVQTFRDLCPKCLGPVEALAG